MNRQEISVGIVEDKQDLRDILKDIVSTSTGFALCFAVDRAEDGIDVITQGSIPDIVLMDIGLPGIDGIEGTRRIADLSPSTRVVMLTIHEDDAKVFDAICAGASGYLLKPTAAPALVDALNEVARGAAPINGFIAKKMLERFAREAPIPDYGLTAREQEILSRLVDGAPLKVIAADLNLSYHTVDNHVRNVYHKLHVRSRALAVAKALREGLV